MLTLERPQPARPERGPGKRRGRQFSQAQLSQLLLALNQANHTMRLIRSIGRPTVPECPELLKLRALSKEELAELRLRTSDLQTDLRAELRRRQHV